MDVEYGEDFSDNRAFYRNRSRNYSAINTRGEYMDIGNITDVIGGAFKNGKALVKVDNKWGIIDTTGHFILNPVFEEVDDAGIVGDYIFIKEPEKYNSLSMDSSGENKYILPKYGVADIYGNIIIKSQFQHFDSRGFVHSLLRTWIDDRLTTKKAT